MWIVRLALRRPYTFIVMGLTILLLGVFAIVTTPMDIFPEIDIPVVSVIWNYDGLSTRGHGVAHHDLLGVHDLVGSQRRADDRVADVSRRRRHQDLLAAEREPGSRRWPR